MQRPRPLVAVRPTDSLVSVVRTLFLNSCSMAPVLCTESRGAFVFGVLAHGLRTVHRQ